MRSSIKLKRPTTKREEGKIQHRIFTLREPIPHFRHPFRCIKRGKEVDDETQWNFFQRILFDHHIISELGLESLSRCYRTSRYMFVRSLPHKEQRGSRHLIIIFRCVTDFLPERKKVVHGQFFFRGIPGILPITQTAPFVMPIYLSTYQIVLLNWVFESRGLCFINI